MRNIINKRIYKKNKLLINIIKSTYNDTIIILNAKIKINHAKIKINHAKIKKNNIKRINRE